MPWKILFTKKAQKQINELDRPVQIRIRDAILNKLTIAPLLHLEPLVGNLSGCYKFRIGDYRLICSKNDEALTVIVIEMGHRRQIYKS